MRVTFHRLIKNDIEAALAYYDATGGPALGDRLFSEIEPCIDAVVENPRRLPLAGDLVACV
jgi:hypothetical protein